MPDPVLTYMVDTLLAVESINRAIQGRIHTGHITNVPQPEYPLVTLQRLTIGEAEPDVPVSTFAVLVSAYSTESYDQPYELLRAASQVLNWKRVSISPDHFFFRPMTSPIQDADRTERQVYWCSQAFEVRHLFE